LRAPVHCAAGSEGETNFGWTSVAAPNAASFSVARYSFYRSAGGLRIDLLLPFYTRSRPLPVSICFMAWRALRAYSGLIVLLELRRERFDLRTISDLPSQRDADAATDGLAAVLTEIREACGVDDVGGRWTCRWQRLIGMRTKNTKPPMRSRCWPRPMFFSMKSTTSC
jgi:hypothetical protein